MLTRAEASGSLPSRSGDRHPILACRLVDSIRNSFCITKTPNSRGRAPIKRRGELRCGGRGLESFEVLDQLAAGAAAACRALCLRQVRLALDFGFQVDGAGAGYVCWAAEPGTLSLSFPQGARKNGKARITR
jgi:hypothetical protein